MSYIYSFRARSYDDVMSISEFMRLARLDSIIWAGEIPGKPQCGCDVEIRSEGPIAEFLLIIFRSGFYHKSGEVMYRTFKECALEENSLEEC